MLTSSSCLIVLDLSAILSSTSKVSPLELLSVTLLLKVVVDDDNVDMSFLGLKLDDDTDVFTGLRFLAVLGFVWSETLDLAFQKLQLEGEEESSGDPRLCR
ncbi:hypothetical protein CDL15_Pgr020813 [Punica granatum]|uniref:Uncharacterized protein n=1 Tax=Punica granatum TaxID=22663 RepID=A0A218XW78_PUNGR|nr:hypothetical protein CDL15_Pgr020813 [Punica granatum]